MPVFTCTLLRSCRISTMLYYLLIRAHSTPWAWSTAPGSAAHTITHKSQSGLVILVIPTSSKQRSSRSAHVGIRISYTHPMFLNAQKQYRLLFNDIFFDTMQLEQYVQQGGFLLNVCSLHCQHLRPLSPENWKIALTAFPMSSPSCPSAERQDKPIEANNTHVIAFL